MSEPFTHARCGGVLVEIPTPEWDVLGDWYFRCDRCKRPGAIFDRRPTKELPSPRGRHPALDSEQVARIRRLHATGHRTSLLALAYGVSPTTILRAVHGDGVYRKLPAQAGGSETTNPPEMAGGLLESPT